MSKKICFVLIFILLVSTSLFAAEPYKGFSSEFNTGILFTVGGNKSYSNSEPYFNFVMGYSFSKSSSAGLSLGTSMVSNNAVKKKTGSFEVDKNNYDNFTILFTNLSYLHKIAISPELFVPVRLFGGGALAMPTPNNKGVFSPDFGLATGIGYDSYRKGLQIGMEAALTYILNLNAKAVTIYPSIKYVF